MATAIHKAKPSKKRAQALFASKKAKKRQDSERELNSSLLQRDRDIAEAPETFDQCVEQPEARQERAFEAPDAGERRSDPSDEYFTHGRSWS